MPATSDEPLVSPRVRGWLYPFDAPSKWRIQALFAVDPLVARMESFERKLTIYCRWLLGIQLLTLAVIAVLVNL